MNFDYEEKKQLIQLAKFMREGNKLYPKKIKYNLFSFDDEKEACSLGCALAMIDPEARQKDLNPIIKEDYCSYNTLETIFPVLNAEHPSARGDNIIGQIMDWNDMEDLSIEEIASRIEALTYE